MKKIFTLLVFALAAISAMAATSFTVTDNTLTLTYEDGQQKYPNTAVTLAQGDDDQWTLTFVGLETPAGKIGDITFSGISVKKNYGEYQITGDNATGTVTAADSPYSGQTLIMQIYGTGSLSPDGIGSETLNFALFSDDDPDFFFECLYAPVEEDEGTNITTFVAGSSESDGYMDVALMSIQNIGYENYVALNIDGLVNTETGEPFGTFIINNIAMNANEPTAELPESYSIKGENISASFDGETEVGVKLIDLTIAPNYGTSQGDIDDDFDPGIDDPGVGPDAGGGEFTLDGKLVITDPTTGKDITYIFSTDADKLTSVKGISGSADTTTQIYSVDGTKLGKMQHGLNIVRVGGKTMKVMYK